MKMDVGDNTELSVLDLQLQDLHVMASEMRKDINYALKNKKMFRKKANAAFWKWAVMPFNLGKRYRTTRDKFDKEANQMKMYADLVHHQLEEVNSLMNNLEWKKTLSAGISPETKYSEDVKTIRLFTRDDVQMKVIIPLPVTKVLMFSVYSSLGQFHLRYENLGSYEEGAGLLCSGLHKDAPEVDHVYDNCLWLKFGPTIRRIYQWGRPRAVSDLAFHAV